MIVFIYIACYVLEIYSFSYLTAKKRNLELSFTQLNELIRNLKLEQRHLTIDICLLELNFMFYFSNCAVGIENRINFK